MNASYRSASLGEGKFLRDNSITLLGGDAMFPAANIAQLLDKFFDLPGETAGAMNASDMDRWKRVVRRENDSIRPLLVRRPFYLWG